MHVHNYMVYIKIYEVYKSEILGMERGYVLEKYWTNSYNEQQVPILFS